MSLSSYETAQLCKQFTGRVYIQKQRINQGGYISGGIYFGVGAPLYYVADEDCIWEDYIRASDRQDAVDQMRERYPLAQIKQ